MAFTFYELVWLYFIYSVIGWCGEVCVAAVRKKKFINRGFVSGPLCPIYGAGAVAFAVFLPELRSNPVFLFLGGVILGAFIEFVTGALLEKVFHRKWWDYSGIRFNFDGYVCLPYALMWGVFALVLTYLTNPFLVWVVGTLPRLLGAILLWTLTAVLVADVIGSTMTILGMKKKLEQISQLTEGMEQLSGQLENAITRRVARRMETAFPLLDTRSLKAQSRAKEESTVFAKGCSFYKLASLFFIGSFLGDITETIFCFVTTGILMSRSSVVYGPFSIVWGLACALLTVILYRIKSKGDFYIFVTGTLLGGAYEYVCSVFTELVFGTVFWDYSGFAFNLGGRINLLYCFFWGIAAVVWMKYLYPFLSKWIEKLPKKAGTVLCNIMLVFMVFNCLISAAALVRYEQRQTTKSSTAAGMENEAEEGSDLTQFLDEHFPDGRMERIYPNAKIVDAQE